MSEREFLRLDILLDLDGGRTTATDACRLLALGRSQVFRLLRDLRRNGSASLVSKRRGRPSNNWLPAAIRDLAMTILRSRYADFGPTLACEKLAERHGYSGGWSKGGRSGEQGFFVPEPMFEGRPGTVIVQQR